MFEDVPEVTYVLWACGIVVTITNSVVVVSSGLLVKKRQKSRGTYLFSGAHSAGRQPSGVMVIDNSFFNNLRLDDLVSQLSNFAGQEPRCMYLLLGNIALADSLLGLLLIAKSFFYNLRLQNITQYVSCCVYLGLYVTVTVVSIYTVGLIAIDRYIYILHGIRYNQLMYPKRAIYMIRAVWILGMLTGIPPIVIMQRHSPSLVCWYTTIIPKPLILATTSIGSLPVVVVGIIYGVILYRAIKNVNRLKRNITQVNGIKIKTCPIIGKEKTDVIKCISNENGLWSQIILSETYNTLGNKECKNIKPVNEIYIQRGFSQNTPSKWKAIKVVLFTVGSFGITWLPYIVASDILALCDEEKNREYCRYIDVSVASPMAIFSLLNSIMNPLIYAWWHNGFRDAFKKLISKKKVLRLSNNKKPRIVQQLSNLSTLELVTSVE